MQPGAHTLLEITSQPAAWSGALDALDQARQALLPLLRSDVAQVAFTGCGSTYYLSLAAAALYQESCGRPARGVPGGELLLNPQATLSGGKTLLVAVSRSGSTTETVRAVETFKREARGPVIAITNYGDQPLAGLADLALVIPEGQEESIAQTRSFASMYVAAAGLALLAGGREGELETMRRLPDLGSKLISHYDSLAREYGENLEIDRYYFLGSGARYGLACEVNLKMKEMTLTHSEPFHFLEFRHGPMSMVTAKTVIVGLLSERNRIHERAVLDEMEQRGANILSLAETGAVVSFASGVSEPARNVLYLPILQLMAFYRSMAKGLNPDRPNNLSAVINLDL